MSILAHMPDDGVRPSIARNNAALDLPRNEFAARISHSEPPRRRSRRSPTTLAQVVPASMQATSDSPQDLPSRIRMLIEAEGSASVIARRCGFATGTVRNWRDGLSDISRERCVTLARTLGISLLWLVAGEGPMKSDAVASAERQTPAATPAACNEAAAYAARTSAVDSRMLAGSLRLLQSYIGLAGGSLAPAQRADALVELYELLARASESGHVDRMLAFHAVLSSQLRSSRSALIA